MTAIASAVSFGPLLSREGIEFRLWAPSASSVDLVVEGASPAPMQRGDDGLHSLFVPGAAAGTLYRFRIDGDLLVPDPAARFAPQDVHGPSEIVDPASYAWNDGSWHGRPWEELVIYELHLGTFTPEGTYRAAIEKLDALVETGITAIELMPVAQSPGTRNWGYDGVLPYAPQRCYGRPDDLKALVDAAHARGLAVFLDVVYNHFGPEGNYLGAYAKPFFTDRYKTPWGAAIDIDGEHGETVGKFFIENALYWLEEFHIDGLRFDAVHEIHDSRVPGFLDALSTTVKRKFEGVRPVHLVLENDDNNVRVLATHREHDDPRFDAQWNDDVHHALHVVATGETYDYYVDYKADPVTDLARALAQGFVYQGQFSEHRGRVRGASSTFLPPTSFVAFAQNHDQIGNRAFGDRLGMLVERRKLDAVNALTALSPMIPLLFMGEEWNASTPFLYFCDFGPELSKLVTEGRRKEFSGLHDFESEEQRAKIPDPAVESTFEASKLRWDERATGEHGEHLAFWRELLGVRKRELVPRLAGIGPESGSFERIGKRAFVVRRTLGDGSTYTITANLGDDAEASLPAPQGRCIFTAGGDAGAPWSVQFSLLESVDRG